jgi:hypothetical protein
MNTSTTRIESEGHTFIDERWAARIGATNTVGDTGPRVSSREHAPTVERTNELFSRSVRLRKYVETFFLIMVVVCIYILTLYLVWF